MKRSLFHLLVLLLVAVSVATACFTSCAKNDGSGSETNARPNGTGAETGTQTVIETEDNMPNLPADLKFDGSSFRILATSRDGAYRELYMSFDEENITETINDAVYRRNMMVEERFGITMEVTQSYDWVYVVPQLTDLVMSDIDYYDMACVSGGRTAEAVLQGVFIDLNLLPYTDFTRSYWDQSCYQQLSIAHKNYLMAGDLSMSVVEGAYATYFNKQMLLDNNIEDDIYEMVRQRTWTFDKMLS